MLNLIKTVLIISVVLLPDYYIVASPFTLRIIAMFLLLFFYLIDSLVVLRKPIQISKDTQNVLLAAFALLLYVYISDVAKNDPVEASRRFYPNLLILTALPIFEYNKKSMDLHKILNIVFGFAILFAIFQILGLRHNLSTLLPEFAFIKSDRIIDPATVQDLRVSGPGFSIISFALYLGYFVIITQYLSLKSGNILLMIYLVIGAIVLLFTQTRSAIYGLLPSILIVRFFYGKRNIKEMFKILFILVVFSISISILSDTIQSRLPRLYEVLDASVLERFQTNYYATIGVLKESPVFGIPKEEAFEVISEAIAARGLVLGTTLRATTTHHNQILYYFRYYGLIGVSLLVMVYVMVCRKILGTPSHITKMMLLSILLFDLQYSLGHNNRLIHNILFWVLLSLASEKTSPPQEQKHYSIPSGNFNNIKTNNRFKITKRKYKI